jgi:hypothetical protein
MPDQQGASSFSVTIASRVSLKRIPWILVEIKHFVCILFELQTSSPVI